MKAQRFRPDIHQSIRDLMWAACSPSLIAPQLNPAYFSNRLLAESQPGTEHQKVLAKLLSAEPLPKTHRLGIYFEQLIALWIRVNPELRLVEHGYQVREEGRTLGEIDFLVEEPSTGHLHHIETAVKFYLLKGDPNRLDHYIGPNPVDRLQKKLHRLVDHQIRISEEPDHLPDHLPVPQTREIWLKGYLFYHMGKVPERLPDVLNPRHLNGFWCYHREFANFADLDSRWIILPKLRWLSPVRATDDEQILSISELLENLKQTTRPRLLVELSPDTSINTVKWTEKRRGFICPEAWPGS